ncbi:MAG TPA: mycothiol synthase [Actinomycetes bacterium]|nr:mycothiol synthase [Actinomycetes bacterium]
MAPDAQTPRVQVEVLGRLDADEVRAVSHLVEAATETDGVLPLSEHVMLHLRYGGDRPVRNLLVYRGSDLVAYGHLDVTDQVAGASAEVVVHPAHRGQGLGRLLVQATLDESPDGRLRLWAHGEHAAAAALARTMGFQESRALWQMRRSLHTPLPAPALPDGVTVRTFEPGRDDEQWVRVNGAAFRDHPEQGGWTLDDLHRRLREPWFDPHGFFLAERGDRLVGFHWTKVHGGNGDEHPDGPHAHEGHGHDPIGEVYVVGVDPAEQGTGLGKALTLTGLRHLQHRGLPGAMLYVESDNEPAIRLYTALGFSRWETDVMFTRVRPPDRDSDGSAEPA